jgi:MinD-like ATPase involved in chromosome partitioning or flagellar assembly
VHGDIAAVLGTPPEQIGPQLLKPSLTRYSANLALLAAPRRVDRYRPMSGAHARIIVQSLARMADAVVLDLPPEPGEAVCEVLRLSEYAGIVLDRETACVAAAGYNARWLRKWGLDIAAGLVIVHRSPVACPVDIEIVTKETGLVVSELIPPAPDACIAAAREGVPLVEAYQDTLIGSSLLSLASNLAADPIVVKKPA